ncbi:hypothetical protein RND64_20245 [Gordonia sp. w5E2]|uniref:hypothetical protein n=1 Tax=Gordonia sp. w5E2 TaxID=3075837 RepID=UPI002F41A98C
MTTKRKPSTTGAALRRHYTEWAREEGVDLDPSDHALIERLAVATDLARKLEASIAKTGPVVITPVTGVEKPNPLLPSLRGQTELCAKLVHTLDRRISDAASGTPAHTGGVQPFTVRGQYDNTAKTGTTDDDAVSIARKPSRTRPKKRT